MLAKNYTQEKKKEAKQTNLIGVGLIVVPSQGFNAFCRRPKNTLAKKTSCCHVRMFPYQVPTAQTQTRAYLTPKVRFECSLQAPRARAACLVRLVSAVLDAGVGNRCGAKTRKWADEVPVVLRDRCCSGKSEALKVLPFDNVDCSAPMSRHTLDCTKRRRKDSFAK